MRSSGAGFVRTRRVGWNRAVTWTFSPTGGESGFEGVCRETHLPTQQETSSNQARVSCPDVHPSWSGSPQGPAAERPQAALGLIRRLSGRDSFARLRREGTRVRCDPLWCVMLADRTLEAPFVAFAIGRSAGGAVDRNRVRRRLRELLRSAELSPGLYLFGLTGSARETSFATLRAAVQTFVSRAGSLGRAGA